MICSLFIALSFYYFRLDNLILYKCNYSSTFANDLLSALKWKGIDCVTFQFENLHPNWEHKMTSEIRSYLNSRKLSLKCKYVALRDGSESDILIYDGRNIIC